MEPKYIIITQKAVQQRNFDASKNYWWPIPRYELNKSTLLDAAPYE